MEEKTMSKKAIPIILAFIMALAILPTVPASAAGNNPWTGKWEASAMNNLTLWQDGEKVIGIEYSNSRQYLYEGTISGNILTGTTKASGDKFAKDFGTFVFTISADGKSMSGNVKGGGQSLDRQFTKTIDYSEVSVNYTPVGAISWTGYWYIDMITTNQNAKSWEPMFILQNGDKVTGYNANVGEFAGIISGNVINATVGKADKMVLTMSLDGMSFTSEFYMSDGRPSRANAKSGGRLSPITYVPAELNASDWAKPELEKAQSYELIPDSLKDADLSKNITRAEFAGVCVKLYENLSGKAAAAASNNPFTDTGSADVLKAYNTGLMVGVSADRFEPNTLLNREQAATALTRVLKKCYIDGWSFAADGSYTLNFTQPAKFADDDKISDWAKPSVYFMAANGIIAGTGSNMFSPRAVTTAEQAANYASATREQALVIAVRMIDKLKDKPLDYTETDTTSTPATAALTMEKIKQTAKGLSYDTVDFIGFNSSSGVPDPKDGVSINKNSATCLSVLEFTDAAQAKKYTDYVNGLKAQYPDTYAKYGYFSYEKFYFQIEDVNSSAGKDVLTALVPNWNSLITGGKNNV